MKKMMMVIGVISLNYMTDVSAMLQEQSLLSLIKTKLSDEYNRKIEENRDPLDQGDMDVLPSFDDLCFYSFAFAYGDIIYPMITKISNNINVVGFIYDNFMIFDPIMNQYIEMVRDLVDNDKMNLSNEIINKMNLSNEIIKYFFRIANTNDDFKRWFSDQLYQECTYDRNIFDLLIMLETSKSRGDFCSLFDFSKIANKEVLAQYEKNFYKIYGKLSLTTLEFINICGGRARDILFCNDTMIDGFCNILHLNIHALFNFMKLYDFDNTMELFNNEPCKGGFMRNLLYVIRLNAADGPCKGVMQHVLSSGRKAQVFRDYLLHICDKDAISSLLPLISHAAVVSQNSGGYSKHSHDWIIDAEIASYDPVMYQELFLSELFK